MDLDVVGTDQPRTIRHGLAGACSHEAVADVD